MSTMMAAHVCAPFPQDTIAVTPPSEAEEYKRPATVELERSPTVGRVPSTQRIHAWLRSIDGCSSAPATADDDMSDIPGDVYVGVPDETATSMTSEVATTEITEASRTTARARRRAAMARAGIARIPSPSLDTADLHNFVQAVEYGDKMGRVLRPGVLRAIGESLEESRAKYRPMVLFDELKRLVGSLAHGWAWTPDRYTHPKVVNGVPLPSTLRVYRTAELILGDAQQAALVQLIAASGIVHPVDPSMCLQLVSWKTPTLRREHYDSVAMTGSAALAPLLCAIQGRKLANRVDETYGRAYMQLRQGLSLAITIVHGETSFELYGHSLSIEDDPTSGRLTFQTTFEVLDRIDLRTAQAHSPATLRRLVAWLWWLREVFQPRTRALVEALTKPDQPPSMDTFD